MKNLPYILLTLSVIFIGWYCFTNRNMQKTDASGMANVSTQAQSKTNLTEINPIFPIKVPRPTPNIETNESIVEMTNALVATNIEQWKAAIKGLHKMPGLSESWHMEETNQDSYVPITLQENGQNVSYKVRFIDISIKNENGDILEAEARSPMMNIDETRELGLQLCNMLQVDPKNFLAWCDKVGNNWLDQPLFGDGNRYYSFHLFHTYNNEKPWSVSFMITPNP